MDAKTRVQLEQAVALYYETRLPEAYVLFRRFFDRIPFSQEPEHAEYIGMYARTLLELGKEFELNFYLSALEKIYRGSSDPFVAYTLAVVYTCVSEPCTRAARKIFSEVASNAAAGIVQTKAQVMELFYFNEDGDLNSCRRILDKIKQPSGDDRLDKIIGVWRAIIFRKEGDLAAAEKEIATILSQCTFESDWYGYLSASIEQGRIVHAQGKPELVSEILRDLRRLFGKTRCKSARAQLEHLEKLINREPTFDVLRVVWEDDAFRLGYAGRELEFTTKTLMERLLVMLVRRRSIDKKTIVQRLYDREYLPSRDDKLIHYQMHALRKRLEGIGVPAHAIRHRQNGYRLIPQVEILGDNP